MTTATKERDLFGYPPPRRYPDRAGWKGTDTSRAAARSVEGHAKSIRNDVLRLLLEASPASLGSEEMATRLGVDKWCISSRVAELKAGGLVERSTKNRTNKTGRTAATWRAVQR